MGIFGGGKEKPRGQSAPAPRGSGAAAARGASGDAAISIIGQGMRVVGDIWTEGIVRVEGVVEGSVRAGRSVIIGKNGEVKGDVVAEEAVIGGRVRGSLRATVRLELQGSSIVEGEISTSAHQLRLEEGAMFEGTVHMFAEGEGSSPGAPQRPENRPSNEVGTHEGGAIVHDVENNRNY
jgi:cytoskeletal protein CcmA (bactofilin family)